MLRWVTLYLSAVWTGEPSDLLWSGGGRWEERLVPESERKTSIHSCLLPMMGPNSLIPKTVSIHWNQAGELDCVCVQTSSFVPLESQDNGDPRYGCFWFMLRYVTFYIHSAENRRPLKGRWLYIFNFILLALLLLLFVFYFSRQGLLQCQLLQNKMRALSLL